MKILGEMAATMKWAVRAKGEDWWNIWGVVWESFLLIRMFSYVITNSLIQLVDIGTVDAPHVRQMTTRGSQDPQSRMDISVTYKMNSKTRSLVSRPTSHTPKETRIARISSSGEASASRLNGT